MYSTYKKATTRPALDREPNRDVVKEVTREQKAHQATKNKYSDLQKAFNSRSHELNDVKKQTLGYKAALAVSNVRPIETQHRLEAAEASNTEYRARIESLEKELADKRSKAAQQKEMREWELNTARTLAQVQTEAAWRNREQARRRKRGLR